MAANPKQRKKAVTFVQKLRLKDSTKVYKEGWEPGVIAMHEVVLKITDESELSSGAVMMELIHAEENLRDQCVHVTTERTK